MTLKMKEVSRIPPGANPFQHDSYHMGQAIAKNWWLMYPMHTKEEMQYLILVNQETGERFKVYPEGPPSESVFEP